MSKDILLGILLVLCVIANVALLIAEGCNTDLLKMHNRRISELESRLNANRETYADLLADVKLDIYKLQVAQRELNNKGDSDNE